MANNNSWDNNGYSSGHNRDNHFTSSEPYRTASGSSNSYRNDDRYYPRDEDRGSREGFQGSYQGGDKDSTRQQRNEFESDIGRYSGNSQYGSERYGSGTPGQSSSGPYGSGSSSAGRSGSGSGYGSSPYSSGQLGSDQYGSSQYGSNHRSYGQGSKQSSYGQSFSSGRTSQGGSVNGSVFGSGLGGSGHSVGSDRQIHDQDFNSGYNAFGQTQNSNRGYQGSQSYGQGSHAGKGPKGWQRSDENIRDRVCECLEQDPHIDASEIEVSVKDRVVTLEGKVDNRRIKRHAEDIIENLPGVSDVRNQITVDQSFFEKAKEVILGKSEDSESSSSESVRH